MHQTLLYGVYFATAAPQLNVCPRAWSKKRSSKCSPYPAQVSVCVRPLALPRCIVLDSMYSTGDVNRCRAGPIDMPTVLDILDWFGQVHASNCPENRFSLGSGTDLHRNFSSEDSANVLQILKQLSLAKHGNVHARVVHLDGKKGAADSTSGNDAGLHSDDGSGGDHDMKEQGALNDGIISGTPDNYNIDHPETSDNVNVKTKISGALNVAHQDSDEARSSSHSLDSTNAISNGALDEPSSFRVLQPPAAAHDPINSSDILKSGDVVDANLGGGKILQPVSALFQTLLIAKPRGTARLHSRPGAGEIDKNEVPFPLSPVEFQASINALKLRIAAKERKSAAAVSAATFNTSTIAESTTGNGLHHKNDGQNNDVPSASIKAALESAPSTAPTAPKQSKSSKACVTKQEVRRRLAELRRQQQAAAEKLRTARADKAHARVAQTSTLMAQLQAQAFKLDRGLAPLRQRAAQASARLKKLRVAEIAAKIQMVQAESILVGDPYFY